MTFIWTQLHRRYLTKIRLKMTLKFHWNLPGANELMACCMRSQGISSHFNSQVSPQYPCTEQGLTYGCLRSMVVEDMIFKCNFMHEIMSISVDISLICMFLEVILMTYQYWFRWWLGIDKAIDHYLNQSSLKSMSESGAPFANMD